jgi:hypothetical protein
LGQDIRDNNTACIMVLEETVGQATLVVKKMITKVLMLAHPLDSFNIVTHALTTGVLGWIIEFQIYSPTFNEMTLDTRSNAFPPPFRIRRSAPSASIVTFMLFMCCWVSYPTGIPIERQLRLTLERCPNTKRCFVRSLSAMTHSDSRMTFESWHEIVRFQPCHPSTQKLDLAVYNCQLLVNWTRLLY